MSERALHTYGALLESRARGVLSDAERGAGARATTNVARARASDASSEDEGDAGGRSRREALEDAAWLEARERENKTWRERANEASAKARAWLYANLWIAFALYLAFAVSCLQAVRDEPGFETFVDAVYFIAITVTTVGYGDISPQTDAGKIFMLFFIIVGIALATVVISKITDLIVDAKERSEVKAQEELDRSMENDLHALSGSLGATMSAEDVARFKERAALEHQSVARVHPVLRVLLHPLGVITIVILIGAATFCSLESGTSYLDGVWWAVVTSTTVGYGDILPTNDSSKIFAACYAFIVVGVMGWAVSQICASALDSKAHHDGELRSFKLTASWLAEQSGDKGYVDKFDFIRSMIIARGVMSAKEFDKIAARFSQLDVNGDGALDVGDLLNVPRA